MRTFKSILDLLRVLPDEQSCINYLEEQRWGGNIVSPFHSSSKVYRCKGNKFRCKLTGKNFTVRTGTIFESSNLPLQKWFIALFLFSSHKRGISSHQLAKDIDVTQATAWFVLERLRDAFEEPSFLGDMEGLIQIDETFVGGKNINRHWDKKVENSQGRSYKDKTPVIGLINADGMVRSFVTADTKNKTLKSIVKGVVEEGSIIVTDEWSGYNGLKETYWHEIVDHGRKQYMNDEGFTSNKIEAYWSHFKRTIGGTYIKVSRKHLQRYCNEIAFRHNTKDMSTQERFDTVLKNCTGRLTYNDLVTDNKTRYEYQFSK